MPLEHKKEYKELYMPKNKPQIVAAPEANYIAVRGKWNLNDQIARAEEIQHELERKHR